MKNLQLWSCYGISGSENVRMFEKNITSSLVIKENDGVWKDEEIRNTCESDEK